MASLLFTNDPILFQNDPDSKESDLKWCLTLIPIINPTQTMNQNENFISTDNMFLWQIAVVSSPTSKEVKRFTEYFG